jgi:hypothetical protein
MYAENEEGVYRHGVVAESEGSRSLLAFSAASSIQKNSALLLIYTSNMRIILHGVYGLIKDF